LVVVVLDTVAPQSRHEKIHANPRR